MKRTLEINSNKTKTEDCEALTTGSKTTNNFCLMKLIALLAVILTVSSLCLLKHIATARGENTPEPSGSASDGALGDQAVGSGASVSSQSMADVASNAVKQGQQFYQDPNKMLEYGLNPVGSALKYFVPNTYQGLTSDLGNSFTALNNGANQGMRVLGNGANQGMGALSNGANQGMGALQSQYGSLSNQLGNGYNGMQQNYLNRQEQLYQQQQALMSRMYDMVANPEQFCSQLGNRRQQSSQQANQMLDQANKGASSFMNALSSSFPVFG